MTNSTITAITISIIAHVPNIFLHPDVFLLILTDVLKSSLDNAGLFLEKDDHVGIMKLEDGFV